MDITQSQLFLISVTVNAIENRRGAWPNLEGPRNVVYIETRRMSMSVTGKGGEGREGKERKRVVSRRESIPPSIDSTVAEHQLYPLQTRLRSLLSWGYCSSGGRQGVNT